MKLKENLLQLIYHNKIVFVKIKTHYYGYSTRYFKREWLAKNYLSKAAN